MSSSIKYVFFGPAVAAAAIAALAGCASRSEPRTAKFGQSLTLRADNDDPDSNDKVQVKATPVDMSLGIGGTYVRFTFVNTSKHSTALSESDFVTVDDTGAWHSCKSYLTPDDLHSPTNGSLDPGQTLTVDAVFSGTENVTKIYYNQGGFVTGGDGTPVQYTSEIQDTWTLPA